MCFPLALISLEAPCTLHKAQHLSDFSLLKFLHPLQPAKPDHP